MKYSKSMENKTVREDWVETDSEDDLFFASVLLRDSSVDSLDR